MNLGEKIKNSDMYPSMPGSEGNKMRYPSVTLPYKLLGKDCELGEEVTMILKGKISRIEKSKYAEDFSVDLTDGELKESGDVKKEEKKEGETLLGSTK